MKTITLTYKGEQYKLTFTRKTIVEMESEGFKLSLLESAEEHPFEIAESVFRGAFKAFHHDLKAEEIEEIIDAIPSKEKLLAKLLEIYTDAVNSLMKDSTSDEGNAMWESNF